MSIAAQDELDCLIAADMEWLGEKEADWQILERKFGGLIVQFSGLAFTCLIALLLIRDSVAFVAIFALMLYVCAGMICLCAHDLEGVRRWIDWHAKMRAYPYAWPWPPTPGRGDSVAEFGGAPR